MNLYVIIFVIILGITIVYNQDTIKNEIGYKINSIFNNGDNNNIHKFNKRIRPSMQKTNLLKQQCDPSLTSLNTVVSNQYVRFKKDDLVCFSLFFKNNDNEDSSICSFILVNMDQKLEYFKEQSVNCIFKHFNSIFDNEDSNYIEITSSDSYGFTACTLNNNILSIENINN